MRVCVCISVHTLHPNYCPYIVFASILCGQLKAHVENGKGREGKRPMAIAHREKYTVLTYSLRSRPSAFTSVLHYTL